MKKTITKPKRLEAVVTPPGDKSISHRAALLNGISKGCARLSNFCVGDDRNSMIGCLRDLGVRISPILGKPDDFEIYGRGLDGLEEPSDVLYAGNSGTTMRLISGLLAGQEFFSVITGDDSLRTRPMSRITEPLRKMGALIDGRSNGSLAPLYFKGGQLTGIEYDMPVASAQLKSCILIAALYSAGQTVLHQPAISRDHTELMMKAMGVDIKSDDLDLTITPSTLTSLDVNIPSDTSSAAFWMVAACCHPNAEITIQNMGMNPTRIGVIEVLRNMGGKIKQANERYEGGEPVADLTVSSSKLESVEISGDLIPKLVDELPILSLAACFAEGKTIIKDAEELRVKESDRLSTTVDSLSKLGADIRELPDGLEITGGKQLLGSEIKSHGDHRIAMTNGIAGLLAEGSTYVEGSESAAVSYPTFWDTIESLQI